MYRENNFRQQQIAQLSRIFQNILAHNFFITVNVPVFCIMSPVSCLVSPSLVKFLLYSVSCLTNSVSCLTPPVQRFGPTSPVSHLLSHILHLLSHVSCLLYHFSFFMSHVSCLTSPVSILLSHIFCLTSPVSALMSHVSCLTSPALCPTMLNCLGLRAQSPFLSSNLDFNCFKLLLPGTFNRPRSGILLRFLCQILFKNGAEIAWISFSFIFHPAILSTFTPEHAPLHHLF